MRLDMMEEGFSESEEEEEPLEICNTRVCIDREEEEMLEEATSRGDLLAREAHLLTGAICLAGGDGAVKC